MDARRSVCYTETREILYEMLWHVVRDHRVRRTA